MDEIVHLKLIRAQKLQRLCIIFFLFASRHELTCSHMT